VFLRFTKRESRFTKPLIGAVCGVVLATLAASTACAEAPRVGVLVIAHGGTNQWDGTVRKTVKQARLKHPTEVALGMGMHDQEVRTLQQAVDRLQRKGVRRIVVVPLFVSSHSEVFRQFEYLFGLRDQAEWPQVKPLRLEVPIVMGRALDDHQLVGEVLLDRAKHVSRSPADEVVVLLAHGPTGDQDNAEWIQRMERLGAYVKAQGGFRDVLTMTFRDDAAKGVRDEAIRRLRQAIQERAATARVLVVPILLARGGVEEKVPKMLAGLSYEYSGQTLLPDPRLAEWIAQEATSLAQTAAAPPQSAEAVDASPMSDAVSGAAQEAVVK